MGAPDQTRYQNQVARRRKVIDDIRARSQAHVTTRDREPAIPDRALSTVLASHRHDIRAAHAGILEVLDLFGDEVAPSGEKGKGGLKGEKGDTGATGATGATGPKGDKGDQGDPGICDCFDTAGNAAGSDALAAANLAGHVAAANPHTGYQLLTARNATSGYAGLDSGGTLAAAQSGALTGDVTKSAGSAATAIAAGAVTLAKQAAMATASVVYRKTAGSGDPEVQTLATLKTDLGLSGTNTGDQTNISGTATASDATAAAALAAHVAAADPHTGYQKESEREAASGYAGLDGSSKVIKDPASAQTTPAASKIPIADAAGTLNAWVGARGSFGHTMAGSGLTTTALFYVGKSGSAVGWKPPANCHLKRVWVNAPCSVAALSPTMLITVQKNSGSTVTNPVTNTAICFQISQALVAGTFYFLDATAILNAGMDAITTADSVSVAGVLTAGTATVANYWSVCVEYTLD